MDDQDDRQDYSRNPTVDDLTRLCKMSVKHAWHHYVAVIALQGAILFRSVLVPSAFTVSTIPVNGKRIKQTHLLHYVFDLS